MHNTVIIHKNVGETPLQAVEAYRTRRGIDASVPLAYAGRLDPMAEGKLLVLIGDACKDQSRYHSLDKVYEIELLLGISSDTHDVLGLAERTAHHEIAPKAVARVLSVLTGNITLPYPAFSSKPVHGTPLFVYALKGALDTIEIPKKTSRIYTLSLTGHQTWSTHELRSCILEKIDSLAPVTDQTKALGADFRREEIKARWKEILSNENEMYMVCKIYCVCSTGTYMRTLADTIGQNLGTGGLALSIKRTRIGTYRRVGPFGVWTRSY